VRENVVEVEVVTEEVLELARSQFIKINRILYQYVYQNAGEKEVEELLSAAWDASTDNEKQFYFLKVMYFINCSNQIILNKNYLSSFSNIYMDVNANIWSLPVKIYCFVYQFVTCKVKAIPIQAWTGP
jgi:hypothetical protein